MATGTSEGGGLGSTPRLPPKGRVRVNNRHSAHAVWVNVKLKAVGVQGHLLGCRKERDAHAGEATAQLVQQQRQHASLEPFLLNSRNANPATAPAHMNTQGTGSGSEATNGRLGGGGRSTAVATVRMQTRHAPTGTPESRWRSPFPPSHASGPPPSPHPHPPSPKIHTHGTALEGCRALLPPSSPSPASTLDYPPPTPTYRLGECSVGHHIPHERRERPVGGGPTKANEPPRRQKPRAEHQVAAFEGARPGQFVPRLRREGGGGSEDVRVAPPLVRGGVEQVGGRAGRRGAARAHGEGGRTGGQVREQVHG